MKCIAGLLWNFETVFFLSIDASFTVWWNTCLLLRKLNVWLWVAKLHWIRAESEAAAPLHPEGSIPIPHLVAGDVTRVRVRNLCAHNGQHADAGDEGDLLPTALFFFIIARQHSNVDARY